MSCFSEIKQCTTSQRALMSLGLEIVKRRKIYHYKQKDFAKEIGIVPAQLCKIEHGKHLPNVKTLKNIEQFLGMIPGTLLNIRGSIQHACEFDIKNVSLEDRLLPICKAHSIPDDALQALRQTIQPKLDEYAELEGKIRIPSNCRISLGTMRISTSKDGIAAANEFRKAIGASSGSFIAHLPTLEKANFRILSVNGLPPIILKDGTTKCRDAFSFYDRLYDNAVICVNQKSAPYAQLYDIAYEIGSYMRFQHTATSSYQPRRNEERFCRAFATALLMTEDDVRDIIDGLAISSDSWSLKLMDNLALRFGVSSLAFLWRIKSIGRIDQELFTLINQKLQDPATFVNSTIFTPRPPIIFDTWLSTLRLRAAIAR